MSATGRGGERVEHDYYPTPEWCVHRLLDHVGLVGPEVGARWLEPCVGSAAIVRAVESWCEASELIPPVWDGIDIAPRCEPDGTLAQVVTADFTWFGGAAWREHFGDRRWDLALSNPPYGIAMDFVQMSLGCCANVAMLLRINWLASEERRAWLEANPPALNVLPNRPNFREGEINPETGKPFGGDATDYAWFCWGPAFEPRVHVLGPTPVEIRKAA